jgi:8-oxo-dGTP pyrophosphatase MutT (NUDIX family)
VDKEEIRRRLAGSCALDEIAGQRRLPTGPGASPPDLPLAVARAPVPAASPGVATAPIPAAVLIALVGSPLGPDIILTQRTAELRNHPAQISLPGGRIEPDDSDPAAAALREAAEEVGLPPERVDILGCLPYYRTVSDYCVHPFVGWVEPPVAFVPDEREVADVFLVPLQFVMDPLNHLCESLWRDGQEHNYYVLPYPGRRIWGATAAILVSLAQALG